MVFTEYTYKTCRQRCNTAEIIDEGLIYYGNCTQDEAVDDITP